MLLLLSISVVSALAYLCLSVGVCGGIPVSLSATYYELGRRGWMFQVFMCIVACTLYPVWMVASSAPLQCLPFLSCASMLFVAAAPSFRMKLEGKVHYTAAAVCCTCAVLWQVLEGLWDITLWFAYLGFMLTLGNRSKWCWWLEVCVIGSIFSNLYRLAV